MSIYQPPTSAITFKLLDLQEESREYLQIVGKSKLWIHQIKFNLNLQNYFSYGLVISISEINMEETSINIRNLEMNQFYFYLNGDLYFLRFDEEDGTLNMAFYKDFPELESWMLIPFMQLYLQPN